MTTDTVQRKAMIDRRIVLAAREFEAVREKIGGLTSDLCAVPHGSPEYFERSEAFNARIAELWPERNRLRAALAAALAPYHDEGTPVRVDDVIYLEDTDGDHVTFKAINMNNIRGLTSPL